MAGVKSWMDQTAASREAAYPTPSNSHTSTVVAPDWINADWADEAARVRRHSLPGPLLPSSSTSSSPPTSSGPSSLVPFPTLGAPLPDKRRTESKLRHVLSSIGESRQPSASDEDPPGESDPTAPTNHEPQLDDSGSTQGIHRLPPSVYGDDEDDADEDDNTVDSGGSGDDRTMRYRPPSVENAAL